ncbi:MAG: hypothetical protein QME62_12065, partial [Armatimonadota bacterium]|nr:hypothetical protein [Armatimonadota bacterium]
QPVVVSDIDIERIEAQVTAGRDLMNFHDLVIHRYPGKITIAGLVFQPFGNARTLNLTAKANSLDIQQLVGSSSLSNSVHGLLSADISITSLGTAPAFAGDVWIENGRIYNQVIDSAHAKVRYAGGSVAFQEVGLRSGDALLKADVNYQLDGSIKASFSGQNFQLANIIKLSEKYPSASGFLSFQGTASGTVEKPQVDLFLDGYDVKVSGEYFKQFTGNVHLSEGQLVESNFVVIDGDSSIKFPTLVYQRNKGLLHLEADIESLSFSKILSLARRILAGYDTKNKVYRLISQIP